jgi:hypothetical protein
MACDCLICLFSFRDNFLFVKVSTPDYFLPPLPFPLIVVACPVQTFSATPVLRIQITSQRPLSVVPSSASCPVGSPLHPRALSFLNLLRITHIMLLTSRPGMSPTGAAVAS